LRCRFVNLETYQYDFRLLATCFDVLAILAIIYQEVLMITLPSALIKLSWRTDAKGNPSSGNGAAIGGICGTAFTISSGDTLTASHHLNNLWQPHDGFDDFDVWVAHPDGSIHLIAVDAIEHFAGFDIARVKCPKSPTKFTVSSKRYGDVDKGHCIGYEASKAPFDCNIVNKRISIFGVNLHRALLPLSPQSLDKKLLEIKSPDVFIDNKPGYVMKQPAKIGLSGGPMIDPEDGTVLAVCCFGLPPDKHQKDLIGAVDLRGLPLSNNS
jgi:hypothetical protein